MAHVYECRPSSEDDRPRIDFEDTENAKNDWLTVGEIIEGHRPVNDYPAVRVRVEHCEATDWDCYMDGGVRGLFSRRFADAVGQKSFLGLSLLPAQLNGATYFFLRCEKPVDCFDRGQSVIETFRSDPTTIKRITRHAFREDTLPIDGCFVQPERPDLLLTETVAQRLQAANLKGLKLRPVS